jgi:predicted ester cyclase
MKKSSRARIGRPTTLLAGLVVASLVSSCAPPRETSGYEEGLPQPGAITFDDSGGARQSRRAVRAARLYYAFWDTGKPEYADAAAGPNFLDGTLPEGDRQGPEGLKAASRAFRTAVPDLRCAVDHLLVGGDQVVARLTFRGTHEGPFLGHAPTGRAIEFSAIDILRVENGRVVEARHVEDNYNSTLVRQLGAVSPAVRHQASP